MPSFRTLLSIVAALPVAASVTSLVACSSMGTGRVPTSADFAAIAPGTTRAEVEASFGRPTWIDAVRLGNMTVLNYRISHSDCVIYQVSLKPDGTVVDTSTAFDTLCSGPG